MNGTDTGKTVWQGILQQWQRLNHQHILLVVLATFATSFIADHVAYSLTPSLSKRLFFRKEFRPRTVNDFTRGNYVTFDTEHPYEPGNYIREIKRVGCTGGQTLSVTPAWEYSCDGEYLGRGKERDKRGQLAKRFLYNGKIPAGMLFVIGDHADSYDSRRLGFIPVAAIKERLWPIL